MQVAVHVWKIGHFDGGMSDVSASDQRTAGWFTERVFRARFYDFDVVY